MAGSARDGKSFRKRRRLILAMAAGAIVACLLVPSGLSRNANATNATLTGHVCDSNGAALVGAGIYVDVSSSGKVTPVTTTGSGGAYSIALTPGIQHTIGAGFHDRVVTPRTITLGDGGTGTMDFTMAAIRPLGFLYHADQYSGNQPGIISVLDAIASGGVNSLSIDISWWTVFPDSSPTVPQWAFYDWFFYQAYIRGISLTPQIAISLTPGWAYYDPIDPSHRQYQKNELLEDISTANVPQHASVTFPLTESVIRERARTFTLAVIDQYKLHPAFSGNWIIVNEPLMPVNDQSPHQFFDYNSITKEDFRRAMFLMMNPGGTYDGSSSLGLTDLMTSWGFSSPFPWSQWSLVEPPTEIEMPSFNGFPRNVLHDEWWTDWMEYRNASLVAFVQWHANIVKTADPSSNTVLKLSAGPPFKITAAQSAMSYYDMVKGTPSVDIYALDFYPSSDDQQTLFRESELMMHLSALKRLTDDFGKKMWIGEIGEAGTTGGNEMTVRTLYNTTALALSMNAKMIYFYDLDPTDMVYSFYPNSVASQAMIAIMALDTPIASRLDKLTAMSGSYPGDPKVAVVFSMADIYMQPYFINATGSYTAEGPIVYTKELVCRALYQAGIPFVVLYEEYLKDRPIPSSVKVLYLPNVAAVHYATATRIRDFVSAGGYLWGDFQAGEFCLDRWTLGSRPHGDWQSTDGTYPMNQAFQASFGATNWDTTQQQIDARYLRVTDTQTSQHMLVGDLVKGRHDENASTHNGVQLGKYQSGTNWAAWLTTYGTGKSLRIATAVSLEAEEKAIVKQDVTLFNKFAVDWTIYTGNPVGSFSDDFEDGTLSPWTRAVGNSNKVLIDNAVAFTPPYSLKITYTGTSGARAATPAVVFDSTKDYGIAFRVRPDNDIMLIIVDDGRLELRDKSSLIYYYTPATGEVLIPGANVYRGSWHQIEVRAHPLPMTFELLIDGSSVGLGAMKSATSPDNKFYVGSKATSLYTESGLANWDDFVVRGVHSPFTAPRNLAVSAGTGKLTLTWSAPTSTGGSPVVKYRVYRWTDAAPDPVRVAEPTSTPYTNNGLTKGTTYYYKVTAVTASGEGPFSNSASGVPK